MSGRAHLRWFVAGVVFAVSAGGHAQAQAAGSPRSAADPTVASLVPANVRTTGALEIGTDATYPPFESIDPATHQVVGFDADIGDDIAALMGLEAHMVNMPFDSLIPSLASGKLAVAMSSIGDTPEREAVVDFVTYYWNSTNVLVRKANPGHLGTDRLCGARIGVERGSLQQTTILPALVRDCAEDPALAAGSVFQTNTEAVLALSSGRIDGILNDAVANDYVAARSDGQFVTVGPVLHNKSPGGVAIRKDSGLQPAILAAVKRLMADGTYRAALDKWGLSAIAIDDPVIDWAGR